MTTPIVKSSTSFFSKSSTSLDMEICQIIVNGCNRDFLKYLENGLDPNHCIRENIYIKDMLFTKGSPLIFLLIHYSTIGIYFWDSLAMIKLLLERGIDIKRQFEYGGGYTNVLDYACENENLIFDDILICLLKSVDSKSIYLALNKIKSSKRREDIKEKLFPDFFSKKEFELLYSNSVSFLEESEISSFFLNSSYFFNEEELCQSLINGNHEKLRNFLDSGISSNYIISCNIKIEDFVCKKGLSLLLITLVYCVERNVSWALFEIISLLLEKGVDLQQECCGINPLDYLCENEQFFLEDIVFCLLTSVSKEEAFKSLNKVEDIERREYLKKNIISKNSLFQFEYAQESTHNVEESIVTCENVKDSCDFLRNDSLFFSLKDIFGYSEKNNKLLLKISEFNQIEEILRNQFYLKKCDEEVCSKISGETFFSFIMSEIKDVYKRHKICLLFLENGYTPETIVSQEMNMASYLCSLRCLKKKSFESRGILIETLCVVFFFFKENTSITYVLEKINNSLDRKVLEDFFINKQTGKFSKNHINFINLIKKESQFTYLPLLKGFLEASLMVNKNVITDKCWNEIEDVFPFLNEIQEKLSKFEKQNCKKQKERRKILLDIFESLLIATVHPNSFKEEKRFFYEHWIQKNLFFFKTTEIKNIVLFLLKRYWGHLFKNKETNFFNLNNAQQIGLYNDQILFEVKKSITDVNLKESIQILEEVCVSNLDNIISEYQEFCFNKNNFSKLEEILKNPSCLKKYDQQIPFKDKGETFISFLLLNDKDIYRRHMICLLFLKNGFTSETIVSKNMSLASYLCSLRKRSPLIEHQHILMETLCLVFFFFKEGVSIETALEKLTSDQDKKRLSNFFIDRKTGNFSKKEIDCVKLIKQELFAPYLPLVKGFLDASLVMNKNIVTEKSLDIEYIFSLLNEVKRRLCNFLDFNSKEQERRAKNLLIIFESLLLSMIHNDSLNTRKDIFLSLFKRESLFFKNSRIEKIVLSLIKKYLGNFLNENNSKFLCLSNNQQINLEKALSEVFEITICEKEVADHFVNFKLLKKLNKSNLNSSDKDNIEKIFLELLDGDFSQIENILKNPIYLQKYDELILDKNGKETFFSFLISEIDDVHIRHKLCILFLKYGFSLETIVSQEMNMVSYLCSLRNRMNLVKNQCVLLETLCAIFFFFEEGVSIKSALQELKSNQDRKLLETFFLDEKTQNFSKNGINFIHLIKIDVNYTYFPLLQGFLDASLVINRNLLTGEAWNVDYILPLLSEIKKKLCNFFKQNTRDQKRRKKLLLNIFESLLLATIHPNSFSEEKRILYNSWFYRETFLFKSVEIKNEVLILFQKHWGHILSKSFENSYISSNERINLNNFMIFPETAELLYITKNQDETMQSFNLKKRSITGFQQESQDVMNKKIRLL